MKAGALDNLHRRLGEWKPQSPIASQFPTEEKTTFIIVLIDRSRLISSSTLLTVGVNPRSDGLERSIERHQAKLDSLDAREPHEEHDPNINTILSSLATNLQTLSKRRPRRQANRDASELQVSTKRRRLHNDVGTNITFTLGNMPPFPDDTKISAALESYFFSVHPWLPIIHEARFRRRLDNETEKEKLRLVVHAIILVTGCNSERDDGGASREDVRDWIVSQAMKQSSVEALQALVIIAYSDVRLQQ